MIIGGSKQTKITTAASSARDSKYCRVNLRRRACGVFDHLLIMYLNIRLLDSLVTTCLCVHLRLPTVLKCWPGEIFRVLSPSSDQGQLSQPQVETLWTMRSTVCSLECSRRFLT